MHLGGVAGACRKLTGHEAGKWAGFDDEVSMGRKEFTLHLVGYRELKLMNVRLLNDIAPRLKETAGMLCGSGGETGSFPPVTGSFRGYTGRRVKSKGRLEGPEPVKWAEVVDYSVRALVPGCALGHQQMVVPSAKVRRGCRRRNRYGGGTSECYCREGTFEATKRPLGIACN